MDAGVQTLVTQLSNGQADLTEAQSFYNDVLSDLSSLPVLTNITSITPRGGLVTLPASSRKLMYLAYNGSTLGELSVQEANWIVPNWEETTGAPQAYVAQSQQARTVQLIPIDSAHQATVIYAETRQVLPKYLQLPVALYILYHEYGRESDHQQKDLAEACKMLADFLLNIIMKQVH